MKQWDKFFQEKIKKIFMGKKRIVDIGGGLRISREKGNRFEKSRKWIIPFLEDAKYKILDTTDKYSPDIIGDIHNLPFANDSQDAIICIAVLEHVENPIIAVKEIYRTLKHGGYCFIYVPFLFYYHAETGYYKDYWRFSEDAIDLLFKDFKSIEKIAVRGRVETWMNFCPFKNSCFSKMGNLIDFLFHKSSKQVSGYNIFLIK